VVIPAIIDLQPLLALRQMLGYLWQTRHLQPNLEILGVLPTRLFPRRQVLYRLLDEMRALCATSMFHCWIASWKTVAWRSSVWPEDTGARSPSACSLPSNARASMNCLG
jgi:hypothetical protein